MAIIGLFRLFFRNYLREPFPPAADTAPNFSRIHPKESAPLVDAKVTSLPSCSNPMHTRLLSFLTDFECSLAADDPAPSDGTWETTRTVNYNQGLARLTLGVRLPDGKFETRGVVMLQSFLLSDETTCLKAALSWTGSASKTSHSIYAKPEINWVSEARKIAAEWMAGPPARLEPEAEEHAAPNADVAAAV